MDDMVGAFGVVVETMPPGEMLPSVPVPVPVLLVLLLLPPSLLFLLVEDKREEEAKDEDEEEKEEEDVRSFETTLSAVTKRAKQTQTNTRRKATIRFSVARSTSSLSASMPATWKRCFLGNPHSLSLSKCCRQLTIFLFRRILA